MRFNDNVMEIKGVGTKVSNALLKLDIETVKDLCLYFPRDFYEYPAPLEYINDDSIGQAAIFGRVVPSSGSSIKKGNKTIFSCRFRTGNDTVKVTYFNMPYIKKRFYDNAAYVLWGKLEEDSYGFYMVQPEVFTREEYNSRLNRILPIYKTTKGLSSQMIGKFIRQSLEDCDLPQDFLTSGELEDLGLPAFNNAIKEMHFPKDYEELKRARDRMVFQEVFDYLLPVKTESKLKERKFAGILAKTDVTDKYISSLPYSLTGAQLRTWREIESDMTCGYCMNRLIQGDVGSGKTIIAFLALLLNLSNGYQGTLMAPTEVLARQHFEGLQDMVKQFPHLVRPVLLIGSLTAKEKREAKAAIAKGEYNIIVGTHAILEDDVEFENMTLCITDEQHRFGVNQRRKLADKNKECHILVMSATPIPRTLSLIMYGDLSVSIIDEMPKGRIPIKNAVVDKSYRARAYKFINDQIHLGHQVYIICPLIEEGEMENLESVLEYSEKLEKELPNARIACLHGKMKPLEKNNIMEKFVQGETDIIVSTTVIEVGVNVKNATVMMVENADRFGLSSLHQLRGRVGRGQYESYCIFVSSGKSKISKKRLDLLVKYNDGFELAREDMKLRGPGDIFGMAQTGDFGFELTDPVLDSEIIRKTSRFLDNCLLPENKTRLEEIKNNFFKYNFTYVDFRTI